MHILKKRLWLIISLAIVLSTTWALDWGWVTGADKYAAVDKNLQKFGMVYRKIVENYFKSVDSGHLMDAGIEGILDQLDPYTQLYEQNALSQLNIDTTGKFGGLGITISINRRVPTVITTIESTPADKVGLLPGDRIVKIEGEPTLDKPLDKVVWLLRGKPGTVVHITVEREGARELLDFEIERDVIKIKSVTFADTISDSIGYIRMQRTKFSQTTSREVQKALRKLKKMGVKGIILDLRGNPGGLLSQARVVADKFLEKDDVIVSIKGRSEGQVETYRAQENPVIKGLPLVVLINRGSASASEIVAGAIQDSDSGLILGTPSFGKGSVQTVFRITEATGLKLTTALYYTPSGRSIHKDIKRAFHRSPLAGLEMVVDGRAIPVAEVIAAISGSSDPTQALSLLESKFDLSESQARTMLDTRFSGLLGLSASRMAETSQADSAQQRQQFKTMKSGRVVYGGGGITPDVEVKPEETSRLARELEYKRMFFAFAVHYAVPHPDLKPHFEVDDQMLAEFKAFLADTTRKFEYPLPGVSQIEDLERLVEARGYSGKVASALRELRAQLEAEKAADFEKSQDYIRRAIKREIISRVFGSEARIRATFDGDRQLWAAVDLLKDPVLYAEKMSGVEVEVAGAEEGSKPTSKKPVMVTP